MTDWTVTSELLDAGLVVAVEVVDVRLGDTEDDGSRVVRRGTVTVRVVEVVKGRSLTPVGETADVDIEVRTSSGTRVPGGWFGIWSAVPLEPGVVLVAFCDAGSADLAVALTDEHCTQLVPDGPRLDDVRLAQAVQRRSPTVDRLLDEAWRRRGEAGPVFARYVWIAVREAVVADAARFGRLMDVATDGGTRADAQEQYLVCAYEDATFSSAFPAERRAALARGMAAAALDPRLGELREHLLSTYLPNLVGAPAPEPLTPAAVFADDEHLRDVLAAEVADPADPATSSPALSAWLREGS